MSVLTARFILQRSARGTRQQRVTSYFVMIRLLSASLRACLGHHRHLARPACSASRPMGTNWYFTYTKSAFVASCEPLLIHPFMSLSSAYTSIQATELTSSRYGSYGGPTSAFTQCKRFHFTSYNISYTWSILLRERKSALPRSIMDMDGSDSYYPHVHSGRSPHLFYG